MHIVLTFCTPCLFKCTRNFCIPMQTFHVEIYTQPLRKCMLTAPCMNIYMYQGKLRPSNSYKVQI